MLFFEPILITFALTSTGYASSYIVVEYGIIEGYVLPLLLLPNFFTNALASALMPYVTKAFAKVINVQLKGN